MRKQLCLFFTMLMLFANGFAQTSQKQGGSSFSASGQFSAASNPNVTWSYGFTNNLGEDFNLYTVGGPCCAPDDRTGWYKFLDGDSPGYPLVFTNSYLTLIGLLDVRPGPNGEYSVVRWTAPVGGTFDILGAFAGIQDCPNGAPDADVHVLRNGTSIFDAEVICEFSTPLFHFESKLKAGETIDFAVGVGAHGFRGQAIGLEAVITPLKKL